MPQIAKFHHQKKKKNFVCVITMQSRVFFSSIPWLRQGDKHPLADFDLTGDSFLFQRAHKWHESGNTLPNKNQFSVNLANVSFKKTREFVTKYSL
jgi:hypothetical protein